MSNYFGFKPCDVDGLVFISYNSDDYKKIAPIAKELYKLNVSVWYDYGLKAGNDDWNKQITAHICKSSVVVLFVTKGIFKRSDCYVFNEYHQAKQLGKTVLPVFIDDVMSNEFARKEARNNLQKFTGYFSDLTEWKNRECVSYMSHSSAEDIAHAIKKKLKSSDDVHYTSVKTRHGGDASLSFDYNVTSDAEGKKYIQINKYIGKNTSVSVPETISGMTVNGICDGAFADCGQIVSVAIPASVKSVGAGAFKNCTQLKSISFPSGIVCIKSETFSGCTSLKNVILPNSITQIEDNAFCGCISLVEFKMPAGVKNVGKQAFASCKTVVTAPCKKSYYGHLSYAGVKKWIKKI